MKNLPKALVCLKEASIAAIREYAADLEYEVRQDAFDTANGFTRGHFIDEQEWQDANEAADDVQNRAHHAIAPLRWIAYHSDVERASEFYAALAEAWRRLEVYSGEGEWDALLEARLILTSALDNGAGGH